MEWLFSWEVSSWVVGGAIAVAFSCLALDDFRLAKAFFLVATSDASGGIIMWGVKTHRPLWQLSLVVFVLSGGIGALTVLALRYVESKRDAKRPSEISAEGATTNRPLRPLVNALSIPAPAVPSASKPQSAHSTLPAQVKQSLKGPARFDSALRGDSSFTPALARTALDLATHISAFILTRQTPSGDQQAQDQFFRETIVLFTKQFGQGLEKFVQDMREHGLGDYRLDWQIAWLKYGAFFTDIPDRLEFIADRLGSEEGVKSLRLPYRRHLIDADVVRLRAELSGSMGHLLIMCPEDDPESRDFANEFARGLQALPGWTVEPVISFAMSRMSESDSSTGIDISGRPDGRSVRKLQQALLAIRIPSRFLGPPSSQLGTMKVHPGIDVVLIVSDIPRLNN